MISPVRNAALPALRQTSASRGTGSVREAAAVAGQAPDRPPVAPVSATSFRGDSPLFAQMIGRSDSPSAAKAAGAYRLQDAADAPVRRLLIV